jgi:hypothetical protein
MVAAGSLAFGCKQRLLQELFSGGMGRLASFPPARPDGCRAPALLLLCSLGSYSRCLPKWLFPGGGAAAVACSFVVSGEVDA